MSSRPSRKIRNVRVSALAVGLLASGVALADAHLDPQLVQKLAGALPTDDFQFNIPVNTPGGINEGAFFGISTTGNTIARFEVSAPYAVVEQHERGRYEEALSQLSQTMNMPETHSPETSLSTNHGIGCTSSGNSSPCSTAAVGAWIQPPSRRTRTTGAVAAVFTIWLSMAMARAAMALIDPERAITRARLTDIAAVSISRRVSVDSLMRTAWSSTSRKYTRVSG